MLTGERKRANNVRVSFSSGAIYLNDSTLAHYSPWEIYTLTGGRHPMLRVANCWLRLA